MTTEQDLAAQYLAEADDQRDLLLRQMEAERSRLLEIFRQAPVGVCVTCGAEHRISAANAAFLEIVGGQDVIGLTVSDAFPELERQGFVDLLDEVYRTGEPYAGNERLVLLDRDQDGTPEPLFFNFMHQPLLDAAGETSGIITQAADVTGQVSARRMVEQRAAELTRLAAELQRRNQELDEFAHVVSHDLKAPLRGIANLSAWIAEGAGATLDETTRRHIAMLRERVRRMESLIDGVLDYSRAGRERGKAEQVDVRSLVCDVAELLGDAAQRIDVADDLPVLSTERTPLQQVLMNLLANALTHGAAAGGRVRVNVRDAGAFWEFSVADDGPGIGAEHHERIWGMFQTLNGREGCGNSGIGLAIVRRIVTARGGRAWVRSAEAEGADFRFLWPKRS
jgi:signal transduction histidine kinase